MLPQIQHNTAPFITAVIAIVTFTPLRAAKWRINPASQFNRREAAAPAFFFATINLRPSSTLGQPEKKTEKKLTADIIYSMQFAIKSPAHLTVHCATGARERDRREETRGMHERLFACLSRYERDCSEFDARNAIFNSLCRNGRSHSRGITFALFH